MIISIAIFLIALVFIITERLDKAIVTVSGALLLVILGILEPEQAFHSIDFETIILLMGMMMIMDISRKSQIFNWLSTKLAELTKGNPFLIFLIFLLVTAFFSAFLDNVTTIIIVVPITIALTKGMSIDPKPYIIGEIMLSNIGGALTLVGDPPNILIGSAAKLSFNEFIVNLWMPILASIVAVIGILTIISWGKIKPIKKDFKKLLLSHILLKKIKFEFYGKPLKRSFIIKTLLILGLTVLGFILQKQLGLSVGIIALAGAMILLMATTKNVTLHETITKIEWPTLLFFMGLFIMATALEETGFLELVSSVITSATDDFTYMLLIILWSAGIISMFLDNIPFVAVMIPVITDMQINMPPEKAVLLWWALALGACLGGNGTIIGASANVVGTSLAEKENIHISFLGYMKTAFPLTLITLVFSSIYIIYRSNV
ncbi:MAG: SLC13 family permease [Patescibacteria group bacterium]|nr:anion permease [Patescibacteria group bacterium]